MHKKIKCIFSELTRIDFCIDGGYVVRGLGSPGRKSKIKICKNRCILFENYISEFSIITFLLSMDKSNFWLYNKTKKGRKIMNKTRTKKLYLSLALLAVLFFCTATLLLGGNLAYAREEFSAQQLVKTDNTVSLSTEGVYTGLNIDAGGGMIEGSLNGIFKGDTELQLRFPSTGDWGSSGGKSAVFTVSDTLGQEVFSVHYEGAGSGYGTGAYLLYEGEYRASGMNVEAAQWGTAVFYKQRSISDTTGLASPRFDYSDGLIPSLTGNMSLEWEEDVLNVYYSALANNETAPCKLKLASFDGTEGDPSLAQDIEAGIKRFGGNDQETVDLLNETAKFGLPKIGRRLENGYTISFRTNNDSDLNLVAVNGQNLTEMTEAPDFYSDWQNGYFISLDGTFPETVVMGANITVPGAVYTDIEGTTAQPVEKMELIGPDNTVKDITSTKTVRVTTIGEYAVRYTAKVDSQQAGNIAVVTFTVSGYGMETQALFDMGADGVFSAEKDEDYAGVHISPAGNGTASAAFNGIFTGNTEIKFSFSTNSVAPDLGGKTAVFTVSDVSGNEVFSIHYASDDGWGTGAYVLYEDEYRASGMNVEAAGWGTAVFYKERTINTAAGQAFPQLDANKKMPGSISLEWEGQDGNVLTVYFTAYFADSQFKLKLASFDGTEGDSSLAQDMEAGVKQFGGNDQSGVDNLNATAKFGLPKIDHLLKSGYTISFRTEGNMSLNVVSVNSMNLSGDVVSVQYDYSFTQRDDQNGTIYVPQNTQIEDIHLTYTTTIAGGWQMIHAVNVPVTVDTSSTGSTLFTAADDSMADIFQSVSKEYTVVVEPGYRLTFETNGGDPIPAIDWSEHTRSRLGEGLPTPEREYWVFDGWYFDEELTDVAALGEIIGDQTVYAKWLDTEAPVVELDGVEDNVTVQVGEARISEGDVRASDAAQGTDVTIEITIKYGDGAYEQFTSGYDLTRIGTYVVRYTVTDPSQNTAYTERIINVIDSVPPVITVNGTIPSSGFTGVAVVLPGASATEGAEVSIVVTINGDIIALENNTFTPELPGLYEVVYSATDENQNTATVTKEIEIIDDNEDPVISGGNDEVTVKKGAEITVLQATATDNCDGTVSVTYKVYYGTQEITTADGKFTAENIGVYRIAYMAQDASGNVATKNVEITVTATGTEGGDSGAKTTGCQSAVGAAAGFIGAAIGAIALVTLLCFKKRAK